MPTEACERFMMKLKKISEQSSPFRRWTTGSGAGSSYRHQDHRNMYNKQMSEGSTQVSNSGNGSNVTRWSLGLEHLLADPAGAAAFAHFLAKEFASENIRFWWSCEQYNATTDPERRRALATEIWQRHLEDKAPDLVNVDAPAKRATELLLHQDPPPPELFQQAQKQIFNMLKFDSYPRFLRSGEHAECARADLRGLPLPYDTQQHNDSSKLKKSASNASERRRSGGGSLLPWKLRAGGRERSNSTQQNDPQPTIDVVKSSQTAPGQCSLCRVVLPDGATSVVGVDPAVSVGRLVERLLQRRNLACSAYDVVLKEGGQVELSAPSAVLGGREAGVERRCVVRLELRGRCVAVRCRAARRLRHVLRPVLARYAPHLPPHAARALGLGGDLVHPDTLMQDLDGTRLQIVEVSESGDYRPTTERDDDADSLSDVAVRIQDDSLRDQDTQSVGGASSRGSRVRAALRPGPPLHHHPPDFLENLRETQQRLRLQKAETSPPASPLAPTATPRTPPPLPPKPTHRQAPTVI
ncbi:unnamed protein product [Arctia plantaginis]|uniref:Regulator of G-protein signaling loco n=1 Tax=Arctia plantaginis TaxID=874455 RepID=A0A8S0YYK3_ARCPL|nr:unnamed protein product [Arctia plantaginis]